MKYCTSCGTDLEDAGPLCETCELDAEVAAEELRFDHTSPHRATEDEPASLWSEEEDDNLDGNEEAIY